MTRGDPSTTDITRFAEHARSIAAEEQSQRWTIRLPGLPLLPNRQHVHWRERHENDSTWRENVTAAAMTQGIPHLGKAQITCTRYSAAQPDYESLALSFKPCIDGLLGMRSLQWLGVIDDDDPAHTERIYRWRPVARNQGYITMEISPLVSAEMGPEVRHD